MRTTVDLAPAVLRRVRELAAQRGASISSVVADLTARGLAQLGTPVDLVFRSDTRVPTISVGRRVTSADVAAALDDE